MPAEVITKWHRSGQYARLGSYSLRPIEHATLRNMPFCLQRGQGDAFPLHANDGRRFILKKFRRPPPTSHLQSIRCLLPSHDGFLAGTAREVLTRTSLACVSDHYWCNELACWLEDSVLMPWIPGEDWAGVADELRDGRRRLDKATRIALCRRLTELVSQLEQHGCAHRDLSGGNVFIDVAASSVRLIDFDSLFHSSLELPANTTAVTPGYAAPFVGMAHSFDVRSTWCPGADRFALALLNVELLVLNKGAPLTSDGGMFEQGELCRRAGPGLECARLALQSGFPSVASYFDAALQSSCFAECPSPQDWAARLNALAATVRPTCLESLHAWMTGVTTRWFVQQPAPLPVGPVPQLSEVPVAALRSAVTPIRPVSLPPDPWT